MGKMTLLEIVQSVLSDLDSDEVNSITDTVESTQVMNIAKDIYYSLTNDRVWPTHKIVTSLTALSDTDYPTHFDMADNVKEIEWVKYNVADSGDPVDYKTITYLEPERFIDIVLSRDSSASNVQTVTDGNMVLLIKNDQDPTYFTSFDDDKIIFDSFDEDVSTTLEESRIMVLATVEPSWTNSDTFTPDIPSKAFPYYLSEVKSTAFVKIKQSPSPKDEQLSRRHRTYLSGEKYRVAGGIGTPNYGRK